MDEVSENNWVCKMVNVIYAPCNMNKVLLQSSVSFFILLDIRRHYMVSEVGSVMEKDDHVKALKL